MRKKKYLFEQLGISFKDKSKHYRIDEGGEESFQEVRIVIEEAVLGENLSHLNAFYDDENSSIVVDSDGFRSSILVHDELHGISYNYRNEKYAGQEEFVEVGGYYAPQKCVCEDTEVLLDIILTFLETGKPCKRYQWFKTQDD